MEGLLTICGRLTVAALIIIFRARRITAHSHRARSATRSDAAPISSTIFGRSQGSRHEISRFSKSCCSRRRQSLGRCALRAAERWYGRLQQFLREQAWADAAHAAGILSHYFTDPLQPCTPRKAIAKRSFIDLSSGASVDLITKLWLAGGTTGFALCFDCRRGRIGCPRRYFEVPN